MGNKSLNRICGPRMELFLTAYPEPLIKERDAETGLPLFDLHAHA